MQRVHDESEIVPYLYEAAALQCHPLFKGGVLKVHAAPGDPFRTNERQRRVGNDVACCPVAGAHC